MKESLAVFADGDRRIGLGHLTRMRSLIRWTDSEAVIVTRTPSAAADILAGDAAEIVAIDEAEEIVAAVAQAAPATAVVVVDPPIDIDDLSASSGPAWQPVVNALRASGRSLVRFTDELAPTPHHCDLLVNDHPRAQGFAATYSRDEAAKSVLAGMKYFVIDPDHLRPAEPHDSLLISFGGGDQSKLLECLEGAVRDISRTLPVHLVIGAKAACQMANEEHLTVHRNLPPGEFAGLLAGARLALTASGNTLFERAFHGVPGISVAQFPHQNTIGQAFDRLGISRHLGLGHEVAPTALIASVVDLAGDEATRLGQRKAARKLDIQGGCAEIIAAVRALQRP